MNSEQWLHQHTTTQKTAKTSKELTLWMGTGFTRPHGARLMILPVDQNDGVLPRQTWIDVCAAFASVLRRDPPQEPAKEQNGTTAADRTPTPKSVTEPPNTSRVTLKNSQGTVNQFSLSILKNSQA